MLLIHQLNTGNMSPAAARLGHARSCAPGAGARSSTPCRARSRASLSTSPGNQGLARRTRQRFRRRCCATSTRRRCAEQLDRAIAALRQSEATDQGPAAPINQQRIAILEKMRTAVSPNLNADLRRDPPRRGDACRRRCASAWRESAASSRAKDLNDIALTDTPTGAEQIEVYAVADAPRGARRAPDEHDSLAASTFVVFRSDVAGQGPQRRGPAHRGVRRHRPGLRWARWSPSGSRTCSDWVLGVVRRMNKAEHRRGRGRRVDHRRRGWSRSRCTPGARPRTTWASSSTASTCRRWARASTVSTCRRRRGPTSRSRSRR